MQLKWGKALPLDYDLDEVRVWARKLQLSKPGIAAPDYLGHAQMYWEDQVPEKFWKYINCVIPLMSNYKGQGPRYCTLWEYQQSSKLIPHIDDFIQLFDDELKKVNSDYEGKRVGELLMKPPRIHLSSPGGFKRWLQDKGKLGGQNKIPRLANHRKYLEEILHFI